MERIVWKEQYSVGVPELDEQHKGLIALINRLTEEDRSVAMVVHVVDALDQYVTEHFRAEEALMRAHRYQDLEHHIDEHRAFEEWLHAVQQAYRYGGSADLFADTVDAFLRHWLINHILESDMAYKPVLSTTT